MGTLAEAAAGLKRAAGSALPALVLMTDEVRLADPVPAAGALPAGSAIVLRHYGVPGRAALARRLAAIAQARGLLPARGRRSGARAARRRGRGPPAGTRDPARRRRALAERLAGHRRRPLPCGAAGGRGRRRRCGAALPGLRHGEPSRSPPPSAPTASRRSLPRARSRSMPSAVSTAPVRAACAAAAPSGSPASPGSSPRRRAAAEGEVPLDIVDQQPQRVRDRPVAGIDREIGPVGRLVGCRQRR